MSLCVDTHYESAATERAFLTTPGNSFQSSGGPLREFVEETQKDSNII